MPKFPKMEEIHVTGNVAIENLRRFTDPDFSDAYLQGDLGIQISEDGRVWICINGIAFVRFTPTQD